LQTALDCPLAGALTLPPGRYRAIDLRLRRACRITGEAAELFWDGDGDRDLLNVDAPSVEISHLTFRGGRYEDIWDTISPHTLLRIDPIEARDAGEVRLRDLTFIGGQNGCIIGLVSNVFIDRVRFEHCRYCGMILYRGPRNIIINGLIAHRIGQYGGIATGFTDTSRATERLVLNDFVISDCACFAADKVHWQEAIDLACGFAREYVISNGVISGCNGGALELKTGSIVLDEDDHYQDMLITNVVMKMRGDSAAVKLNWTGAKSNTGKRGRRIVLSGNVIRHEGATDSNASGISIAAFSEIHIANNYIEGCHTAIKLSPRGASDDTLRDIRVTGNQMRDVTEGIAATGGRVEQLEVAGNTIDCTVFGVALAGAVCRDVLLAHNRIRQRGRIDGFTGCIQVRNARAVEIWSNYLDAEQGKAVQVLEDSYGATDGTIVRNIAISADGPAFRIDGGNWQLLDNVVRAPSAAGSLTASRDARVAAGWNVRGYSEHPPTHRGAVGDVVLAAGRSVPPPGWWFKEAAGGGAWEPMPARQVNGQLDRPLLQSPPASKRSVRDNTEQE
jgi:hypothetical protein